SCGSPCKSMLSTGSNGVLSVNSTSPQQNACMGSTSPLLLFLLMMVSGWVHRRQLIIIEFLQAENQPLLERLRGRRIRFIDAECALRQVGLLRARGSCCVGIEQLAAVHGI